MNVVQVKNPAVLLLPEVQEMLQRAVEKAPHMAPRGLDSIAVDLYGLILDECRFFLLAWEDGKPSGFAFGSFPSGNLFPYPSVGMLYNEGSKAALRALSQALKNTILSKGYRKVYTMNVTGRSDKAWEKVIAPEGVSSTVAGSVMVLEVGEET